MTYPVDNLPPIHPGEILSELYCDSAEFSLEKFAADCGIPLDQMNAIFTGRASITAETAARISAVLGTTAQYWLNLQSLYDAKIERRNT